MSMDVQRIPDNLIKDLVSRKRTVEYIQESTPEHLFAEILSWHGLIGWGPILVTALDALRAAEITETEAQ